MPEEARYAIGDLAELAGVSRRTVRYYVQEGLLPAPLGVGRGNHYSREHLDQLLKVKALQEGGRTLEEIRRLLEGGGPSPLMVERAPARADRALYRRLTLAPGVELHVSGQVRLPAPAKLNELAACCRRLFAPINPLCGSEPEFRTRYGEPHNGLGAHSAPARERRGVSGPRERPSRGVGRSPTLDTNEDSDV
jgi:DNA-binding transcriptional MerR regulator